MSIRYGQLEDDPGEPHFTGGTVAAVTLGERLRAAIDAKNKAHAWVADEVGITASSLSAILTGKTADPSFFTVLAIVRAIDEPLHAIVDDPLAFWSSADLERLGELGRWLVQRSTREHAGFPLEVPPRKKKTRQAKAYPVAATSGGVLYPDASELPRKRIPARFVRMHADAVFSVSGESMTGEGIHPTDLLYVRRTPDTAEAIDRIVVCVVDDMVVVKRLRTRGRKLVLESAHRGHEPMVIDETSSRFRLIGIVVGTSRT